MSRPFGTYKLNAEQRARVYAEWSATHRGRRLEKLEDLAEELNVSARTLERLVYRESRARLAAITQCFTETDINSTGDSR
jgi:hypothetical protein